eukprot:786578_1
MNSTVYRALEEERSFLMQDIEFLESCLEDEVGYKNEIVKTSKEKPPSIEKLRQYSQTVKDAWLNQDRVSQTFDAIKKSCDSPIRQVGSPQTRNKTPRKLKPLPPISPKPTALRQPRLRKMENKQNKRTYKLT